MRPWYETQALTTIGGSWYVFGSFFAGFGIGAISRWVRPSFPGPIHYEAMIALVVEIGLCVALLILHLRYRPIVRATLSLEGGLAALWCGNVLGWSLVHGSLVDDLLAVDGVCWLISGIAGAVILVALGIRRDRVRRGPYCRTCGYCLIGLAEHRCPECGKPFDPSEMGLTEADLTVGGLQLGAEARPRSR
jgi:hypothetical protein